MPEIATLQTTFEQNVLKEKNASSIVVDTREELAGLSGQRNRRRGDQAAKDRRQGRQVRHPHA